MKSRKEAHRTSDPRTSSTYSSQSLRPNRSKSPKQRRPSIFHRLRSFRRGSVDPSEHLNGQKYSCQESKPSSDVACSHTNMDSSKEGDNDREAAGTPGNHTLHTSKCLYSKILVVYYIEQLKSTNATERIESSTSLKSS